MSNLDFLSQRRRRSPLAGAFFAPADLSGFVLVQTLASLSNDLIQSHPSPSHLHSRHARSLLFKIRILLCLFQYLTEHSSGFFPHWFPDSATLCFRELYILIHRAKLLLDYCEQSARLWLVLKSSQVEGNFRDLDQELSTLLDVLPIESLRLSADVREQIELLRKNCAKLNPKLDPQKEAQGLRNTILEFLDEFNEGRAPDTQKLQSFFVNKLRICDRYTCSSEVEFLEEQIYNLGEDADLQLLGGTVALARYCRFSLFEETTKLEMSSPRENSTKLNQRLLSWSYSDSSASFGVPKDFCCPISLDLMRDPVVASTGQTYDRSSIVQWIDEGHATCPNSGQLLPDTRLVPNRALRSIISHWCTTYCIPYDSGEALDGSNESVAVACTNKATIEANYATARILIRQLAEGSDEEKGTAAREIRLLAKTGKCNRAFIAELGAIPLLTRLLNSSDSIAQENAVTALLNLSIFDENKKRIMEQEGCLSLITNVLKQGWSIEARENAAATLFSLSVVHDYKAKIISEPGGVKSLSVLLKKGTPRGRKDAVMALFNLSTHPESWVEMLDSGAVISLAESLITDSVSEEAAGALALLAKHLPVAQAAASVETAVPSLIGIMKRGTPKGKENAIAALQEICRRCGPVMTQRVARTPGLGALVQGICLTGTKRAKRKAGLLAKFLAKWCELNIPIPVVDAIGESSVVVGGTAAGEIGTDTGMTRVLRRESSVVVGGTAAGEIGTDTGMTRVLRRVESMGSGDMGLNQPMAVPVP